MGIASLNRILRALCLPEGVGASLLAKGVSRWLRCFELTSPLSLTLSLKGEGTVGQDWVFWRQPATPKVSG